MEIHGIFRNVDVSAVRDTIFQAPNQLSCHRWDTLHVRGDSWDEVQWCNLSCSMSGRFIVKSLYFCHSQDDLTMLFVTNGLLFESSIVTLSNNNCYFCHSQDDLLQSIADWIDELSVCLTGNVFHTRLVLTDTPSGPEKRSLPMKRPPFLAFLRGLIFDQKYESLFFASPTFIWGSKQIRHFVFRRQNTNDMIRYDPNAFVRCSFALDLYMFCIVLLYVQANRRSGIQATSTVPQFVDSDQTSISISSHPPWHGSPGNWWYWGRVVLIYARSIRSVPRPVQTASCHALGHGSLWVLGNCNWTLTQTRGIL